MTNKYHKLCNKKKIKMENEDSDVSKVKKRVLSSSADVDRMAVESSKARLISQLVSSQDERVSKEFDLFLQGGLDAHPSIDVPSRKLNANEYIVDTYSAQQNYSLRWNPYVEVNTESQKDEALDGMFNCKCNNCTSRNCPSRTGSSTAMRGYSFKDNIMRFNDQFTMTAVCYDACCDVRTPLATPINSSVSINTFKEKKEFQTATDENRCIYPTPILKKSQCSGFYKPNLDEAVRDTDIDRDYCKSSKYINTNDFHNKKTKPEVSHCVPCATSYEVINQQSPRKVLYNEGISDMVARHYPVTPVIERKCSHRNVGENVNLMRPNILSKCYDEIDDDNFIPHGHRGKSRYHHYCKIGPQKVVHYDTNTESMRHIVVSPKKMRQNLKRNAYTGYGSKCTTSVCMPKKVLTSERNIDNYFGTGGFMTLSSSFEKRKRKQ